MADHPVLRVRFRWADQREPSWLTALSDIAGARALTPLAPGMLAVGGACIRSAVSGGRAAGSADSAVPMTGSQAAGTPAMATLWQRCRIPGDAALPSIDGDDDPDGCAYLHPSPEEAGAWARALSRLAGVVIDRLQPLRRIAGAATGSDAPWHYVVETDVADGGEDDLNAWYDREHLPGLAAVPGTVTAHRHRNDDHGPRHHAAYDLARVEVFGSAPWVAVRSSAWSSRVRPTFRNTRRTMYRRVRVVLPPGAAAR